jgi:hypothetical protein
MAKSNYTRIMLELILPEVSLELGMRYYKEYFGLDAILYHEIDGVHFDPKYSYAKYISVAVEHENEYSCAAEEMNNLQLLNVPLTVLITYPPRDKAVPTLAKYAAIIEAADVLENVSTQRRQVAILGYLNVLRHQNDEWEAFTYQDGGFIPVAPIQSLAAGQ